MVVDYYPYGKVLREYVNGQQERFLTTQHERDVETGLDYRGARFYDADVARFLSLDPHAVDYPDVSDYVYVGANPVMFIDPDGKDLRIHYGSGENDYVTYKDGQLLTASGEVYEGDNEFVMNAFQDLNRLNKESNKANEIIGNLVGSEHVYSIKRAYEAGGTGFMPNSGNASTKGIGSGGTISWNDLNPEMVPVESSNQDSKEIRRLSGLIHELGHAENSRKGIYKDKKWLYPSKPIEKGLAPEEAAGAHVENIVRSEMNFPLRTHYDDSPPLPWDSKMFDDVSNQRYRFPLFDKSGNSIYYPTYNYKRK